MIDPKNEDDVLRLHGFIEGDYSALEYQREERQRVISDYVGQHFADPSVDTSAEVPVNFLEMAVSIYARQLMAQAPSATCTSWEKRHRPLCEPFEKALNRRVRQMGLEDELNRVVIDSLFRVGIMKVHRDHYRTVEHEGQTFKLNRTMGKTIDFDDWVHDTNARRWTEVHWAGHKLRFEYDAFQDSPFFPENMKEEITPHEIQRYDPYGGDKVENLGKGIAKSKREQLEFVELWEVWLPREKQIVYMPVIGSKSKVPAIKVVNWRGPKWGPYHILGFGIVPNNVLPLSPITDVLNDLNDLANEIFCKMGDQARRQKKVGAARAGSEEDVETLRDLNDGEIGTVNELDSFIEASFGGVDQNNVQMFLQTKQLIDQFGGNLSMLGGLGPQSETATQDTLLAQASQAKIRSMQDRVIAFTRDVFKSIAFWEWKDGMSDPYLTKQLKGGVEIPLDFSSEARKGKFTDYDIDIHPFSLQDHSPQTKVRQLDQFVQQIIMPMSQYMRQFGMMFDIENYVKTRAKLLNMPEIEDLVMWFAGTPEEGAGEQSMRQAPVTERINTRVNRPGATPQGNDQIMGQIAAGGRPQQAEAQALFREMG